MSMPSGDKTLARDFMQAWSAGGESIVDTLAAPDLTVFYSHFPAPVQGVDQFKEILRQTHASFPDLKLTVQEVLGEGDQFMVHWRYQGTTKRERYSAFSQEDNRSVSPVSPSCASMMAKWSKKTALSITLACYNNSRRTLPNSKMGARRSKVANEAPIVSPVCFSPDHWLGDHVEGYTDVPACGSTGTV